MRRKLLGTIIVAFAAFLLTACGGKSVDLTDYVEVSYEGMDSIGTASYSLDLESAIMELYNFKSDNFEDELYELYEKKPAKAEEIQSLFGTVDVSLDKDSDLTNGDKITANISVAEEAEKSFKGGKKEFTVEGLEEPEVINADEVKKHIIVDFNGASEKGKARIENTFKNALGNLTYAIENDGALANGDKAKLIIDEEDSGPLIEKGYKLADDFEVTYEVTGLNEYAKSAKDIKNLKDIERMISEEVKKSYPSKQKYDFETRYDVKEEVSLYRQFADDDEGSSSWFGSSYDNENHGAFITLYTIKRYNDKEAKDNKDVSSEYIYARGFKNLIINEDGKVNVSKISDVSDANDDSYSLETVQQIYEGNGYEVVK